MHLAEFNYGILIADWDDPAVAEFVAGLDAVNAAAARSPGFVWRLSDDDMDAAQRDPAGALGGDLRLASTLSVWEDAASLHAFVFKTIHRRFLDRGAQWFEPADRGHMVLWHVPEGHRPGVAEGMDRMRHWRAHGDTAHAFGWAHLKGTLCTSPSSTSAA